MNRITILIAALMFVLSGNTETQAAPQSGLDAKSELLQSAIDCLAKMEDKEATQRSFQDLVRTAATLGEVDALRKLLSDYDLENPTRQRCEAIECLAFYGHQEYCLDFFDGTVDSMPELEMLTNLAYFCGKVPDQQQFYRELLQRCELRPFEYSYPGGFGDGDGPDVKIQEDNFADIRSEISLAYVCGLIDSKRLKRAIVEAADIESDMLREVAEVRILQSRETGMDFPEVKAFENDCCHSSAKLSRAKWLLHHGEFDKAILVLRGVAHHAGLDLMLEIISRKLDADPKLTNWDIAFRTRLSQTILLWMDAELNETFDPFAGLEQQTITNSTLLRLASILELDRDGIHPVSVLDSIASLGIPVELSLSRKAAISIESKLTILEYSRNQHLNSGEWDKAREISVQVWKGERVVDPFGTDDDPFPVGDDPFAPDDQQQSASNHGDLVEVDGEQIPVAALQSFYKLAAKSAARTRRYDDMKKFLESIVESNEDQVDSTMLQISAWQIQNGDADLVVTNLQPFANVFHEKLKTTPQSERLKFVVESAMRQSWKLDQEIEKLPMATQYENALLALNQNAEAILLLKSYQNSFTKPGPAGLAFAKRMIAILEREVESKLPVDQSTLPPAEQLRIIANQFRILDGGNDQEIGNNPYSAQSETIIRLVKQLKPNEYHVANPLIPFLAKDGDAETVETILALVVDPEVRISITCEALSVFPPVNNLLVQEYFGQRWQGNSSGGVF